MIFPIVSFKINLFAIKLCRGSEVVKRTGLKIPSLSGFRGSNPLSCIYYGLVAQPGLEHFPPTEKQEVSSTSEKVFFRSKEGVAGSNPAEAVLVKFK
tara:strand:- start:81 stop:371 length:291 start_codon:yes stop_codon:yes gene_type:complete